MVIVLLSITLLSSAAVGVVYQLTAAPIANAGDNKLNEAIKKVIPNFEKLDKMQLIEMEKGEEPLKLYTARTGSKVVGYAIESYSKKGYGGTIRLLVGFTPKGDINKVAVISHAETPGLGAKISEEGSHFVTQFEGKNPKTFKMSVKKDGGDVDAITASTITSNAYIDVITKAHNELTKIINK